MTITISDIEKLAELSRIDMPKSEMADLQNDLQGILGFVDQIGEATAGDTVSSAGEHRNVMREDVDVHESGKYTEDILCCAPESESGYLKVKKIL